MTGPFSNQGYAPSGCLTALFLTLVVIALLSSCSTAPSAPEIRRVYLSDGSFIYAKCGVTYDNAVADTMPPGSHCLDWEMARARDLYTPEQLAVIGGEGAR